MKVVNKFRNCSTKARIKYRNYGIDFDKLLNDFSDKSIWIEGHIEIENYMLWNLLINNLKRFH